MSIKSAAMRLLVCVALGLLTHPALAQIPANSNLEYGTPTPSWENAGAKFAQTAPTNHNPIQPFHSINVENDARPFAPAETSGYGNGPRPHVGWFGSYERLYWSYSRPETQTIGAQQVLYHSPFPTLDLTPFDPDGPSVDNSFIGSSGAWGNRYEVGYVDNDNYGWLVSVLDHVSQGTANSVENPSFLLGDPLGALSGVAGFPTVADASVLVGLDVGDLPYKFREFHLKNQAVLNGTEIMRTYRAPRLHNGGFFELMYGVRWFQLNDAFQLGATGNGFVTTSGTITPPLFSQLPALNPATVSFPTNILDSMEYSIRAINNLVGPQIGGRWFTQRGRWMTSVETRFMAAANFQNVRLKTKVGTLSSFTQALQNVNMFTNFRGLGVDVHQYSTTFAPMGELRVNVDYNVTRNVAIKVGYTGLVAGGMTRASTRLNYDDVNLIGIKTGATDQLFFSNGLSFGVEVNR